jgi:hypothetical protein
MMNRAAIFVRYRLFALGLTISQSPAVVAQGGRVNGRRRAY